ncbi:MAG: hypothetical protein N2749_01060 [Clostridia bacterium]|nr:hypothetical protein [Clostridia bacterium]
MSEIKLSKKHGFNPSIPVCFWCGKEKNEIALFGELPKDKEAPMKAVYDYTPCRECQKKMAQGILVIEAVLGTEAVKLGNPPIDKLGSVPTGRWLVMTRQYFEDNVDDEDLKQRILKAGKTLMDPATFTQIVEQAKSLQNSKVSLD